MVVSAPEGISPEAVSSDSPEASVVSAVAVVVRLSVCGLTLIAEGKACSVLLSKAAMLPSGCSTGSAADGLFTVSAAGREGFSDDVAGCRFKRKDE